MFVYLGVVLTCVWFFFFFYEFGFLNQRVCLVSFLKFGLWFSCVVFCVVTSQIIITNSIPTTKYPRLAGTGSK